MKKDDSMIIADYTQETLFTLDELCQICASPPEFIHSLITYDIVIPDGNELFNVTHLTRIRIAKRLHHDLELNLPSIAIVLDLLEQIEDLKNKTAILEKHILRD